MSGALAEATAWSALAFMLRAAPLLLVPGLSPFSRAPLSARLALTLAVALIAPTAMATDRVPETTLAAGVVLVGEFAVGVLLVMPVRVALGALEMAGAVIDLQTGAAAAAVIDPTTQVPHSVMAGALELLGLTLFFAFGLHTLAVQGLVGSYAVLPDAGALLHLDPGSVFELIGTLFALALLVVAPVIVALLLADVLLAYGARLMPQANVYFIGLPVKLALGMFILAVTLRGAGGALHQLLLMATPGQAWAGR